MIKAIKEESDILEALSVQVILYKTYVWSPLKDINPRNTTLNSPSIQE